MNVKKSIIIVSLCCTITALSCAFLVTNQKKSMAQEVNNICEDIVEDVESMHVVSPEIAMSSNPYDYIKNCDAYDDLVALGKDAIPEIGRQIVNGSKYKTKTVNNSFTKQSGYGECVFVMYK